MVKIRMSEPYLGEEELKNATQAISEGWISSNGRFIEEFEKEFSSYIGTKNGITMSNGTTAIHAALLVLGIKRGDKVIVPSLTSIACTNAIAYIGAEPVFADSTQEYWCMDPEKIEGLIDSKTKAIMPVHIYGHPCDMDRITEIAKKHDLRIIEDCAEAHGALYRNKKVGNFSDIACFSFYGNKIITTGEGGMCLTNNQELADSMRVIRNQATKPEYKNKYYYDMVGYNYRMTNIQAAIGVAQLKKIDYLIRKRRELAKLYNDLLGGSSGIVTPPEMPWAMNIYWYYSILVERGNRDKVTKALEAAGIESRPFFYPIHMLPMYKKGGVSLPVSEDLGFRGINLPSGPQLSEEQIKEVAAIILKAV